MRSLKGTNFCIKKNLKDLPQPLDSPLIDGIFTRFTPPSSTHQTMENPKVPNNGTIPKVAPEKILLGRPFNTTMLIETPGQFFSHTSSLYLYINLSIYLEMSLFIYILSICFICLFTRALIEK